MKIEFNEEKNKLLKETRWVCFEDVMVIIENWEIIDIIPNENYKNQQNLVIKINNYIYICPFIQTEDTFFLKTLFPSRKHNKIYLKQNT